MKNTVIIALAGLFILSACDDENNGPRTTDLNLNISGLEDLGGSHDLSPLGDGVLPGEDVDVDGAAGHERHQAAEEELAAKIIANLFQKM